MRRRGRPVTIRFPVTLIAAALVFLRLSGGAMAGAVEDCRSKADMTNESRMKACTAVIDGQQASPADTAYAHYKRAITASADPNAEQVLIMADVSKAIELDPKLMEAYAFRAFGYNRAMQYDKAIADLSKAIEIAPERWGLFSLRAMVEVRKKDTKAAIADYKSALALNPPPTSAAMIRQTLTRLEQTPAQ